MRKYSVYDHISLSKQLELQKQRAWNLETDISWSRGVDLNKFLVPLDDNAIVFPNASAEERLVLSQLIGLIINQTICEMEYSLPRLKLVAWQSVLDRYPVNPEMYDLGEQFFDEELKHARSFTKYFDKFCEKIEVEPELLSRLMPRAFGSYFQHKMIKNAENGGAAFWLVVSQVEEVSVEVFKAMNRNRNDIDPLFFELHKRHAEEEIRHESYAFLMLEILKTQTNKWSRFRDSLLADWIATPWMVTELTKVFEASKFAVNNKWLQNLSRALERFKDQNKLTLWKTLLADSPYISWISHPGYKKKLLEDPDGRDFVFLGKFQKELSKDLKTT